MATPGRASRGLAGAPWVPRAPDVSLELSMRQARHLLELKHTCTLGFVASHLTPAHPSLFPPQQQVDGRIAKGPWSPDGMGSISDTHICIDPSHLPTQGPSRSTRPHPGQGGAADHTPSTSFPSTSPLPLLPTCMFPSAKSPFCFCFCFCF